MMNINQIRQLLLDTVNDLICNESIIEENHEYLQELTNLFE